MFIAARFTVDKTQKQPKCPSSGEWIKKICYTYIWYVYMHTQWNISHKKEWNDAVCSNMDSPIDFDT